MLARTALRLLSSSARAIPTTAYVLTEGMLEFELLPAPAPKFIYGAALEALEELSEPQGRFSLACPPIPQEPQIKYRAGFAFVEGAMRDCPGSAQDRAGAPPVLAK